MQQIRHFGKKSISIWHLRILHDSQGQLVYIVQLQFLCKMDLFDSLVDVFFRQDNVFVCVLDRGDLVPSLDIVQAIEVGHCRWK